MKSEADLQAEIVDALSQLGCKCVTLQLNGVRGWPDLTVFKRGDNHSHRPVFLELKVPGGKISKQQWAISEFLFDHGQVWYCADNVADAVDFVKREFGIK